MDKTLACVSLKLPNLKYIFFFKAVLQIQNKEDNKLS